MNYQFENTLTVDGIALQDLSYAHSTSYGSFKKVKILFDNGESEIATLKGDNGWTTISFSTPIKTTRVKISALEYYNPEILPTAQFSLRNLHLLVLS